jgi:hypothetical protein
LIAAGKDYSGIELDGWLERQASVKLPGGPASELQLRADVPAALTGQRLQLLVNSRQVAVRDAPPGAFQLEVPLPASQAPRQVELRWAVAAQIDPPRDPRRAAALLRFLGLVTQGGGG